MPSGLATLCWHSGMVYVLSLSKRPGEKPSIAGQQKMNIRMCFLGKIVLGPTLRRRDDHERKALIQTNLYKSLMEC